jgi:hypothetical protein
LSDFKSNCSHEPDQEYKKYNGNDSSFGFVVFFVVNFFFEAATVHAGVHKTGQRHKNNERQTAQDEGGRAGQQNDSLKQEKKGFKARK